ncbi:MAG: thioredoxin family protein [Flavobacteriaceae bacterium]|nr:thioredoxin family protein [Flavobacteriaceae bacterium]
MKKYWGKAISFEEYLQKTEDIVNKNEADLTEEEKGMLEYYKLGVQRMNRMLKVYKPDENQLKTLEEKQFKGKFLVISEGWCGDAGQTVPAVSLFFKGKNEVRVIYRDENPELIDQFLTNGTRSIPIVVILNENDEVITHWGPRPAYGTELLKKHKANPEEYPKPQFYNDLQLYYAKNRGFDVINEILELI